MGKKKLLYTKNTYMLKLFLDIATARNWGTWYLLSTPYYCWSSVIGTSFSGRQTGGSHSQWYQGCKEGGQTAPCWNAPAVLKSEQLYVDAHCHGGALHHMSAFHAFYSEWPYAVF
jgi:hypothetical protein